MPVHLQCDRGHHWSATSADTCPECGAPASRTDGASTVDASAVTSDVQTDRGASVAWHLADPSLENLESAEVVSDSSSEGTLVDASVGTGGIAISGFAIVRELGRGGMGVVYEARQTALGRVVALKMILAGGHAHAKDRARFRTEAESIARLQHPNIVQIHEVGEHEGKPYFSLEFCAGGSLSARLRDNPLPPREAAALVEKLARAMAFAHERGIIHRDLKPANVLLAVDGEPKITDFGLAKKMEDEGELTHSGAIMGTPSYMAPEQALGDVRRVGPPADIYSLGAILYECLAGRAPFKAASTLETLDQVCHRDPVPPSQLNPLVPRDLETICLKCLRKEPARRYAGALDLANDLACFRENRPIAARPVPGWERLFKWVRRNPMAAALIVVLAAGLAISSVASYLAVRERERAVAAESRRAEEQTKRLTEQERATVAESRRAEEQTKRLAEQKQRTLDAVLSAARVAAQRGDWPEVLATLDRVTQEGGELSVANRLLRIRALEAIYRPREALDELNRLADDPDLGDHQGAVDLYRGELMIGVDDAEAEKLLRRALARKLTEAERFYAEALLADNIPEARDGFLRAIAADRFQREARTLAGLLLYLEGRYDEAKRLADQFELLFPEHPDGHLLHAIVSAAQGDSADMQKRLDRLAPLYGRDMIDALKNLLDLIPVLGRALAAGSGSLEDVPIGDRFKMAMFFSRALTDRGRTAALMSAWRKDDGSLEGLPMFRFPPSFRPLKAVVELVQKDGAAFQKGEDLAYTIANDPKQMAALEKLRRDVPIGFVHFYHGYAMTVQSLAHLSKHGQDERHAELLDAAAASYEQALKMPGFIDVRLVAMDGYILMRGFRGSPKYKHPDPEALKAAVAMIHRRVAIAPLPRGRQDLTLKVLKNAREWNFARTLLDDWSKARKDDPFLIAWSAEIEFGAGNWTAARDWARTVLARETANARMKEIAAECDKRLRAATKE